MSPSFQPGQAAAAVHASKLGHSEAILSRAVVSGLRWSRNGTLAKREKVSLTETLAGSARRPA